MKKSQLRFGIVGTGMIAGIIADAIDKSANSKLIAVSGRKIDSAQSFVAKRQGVAAVQGIDDLLARADVDAVYIAIPTAPEEEIARAVIAAGKHVLVDKPFVNHASLLRMTDAAAAKGVAFMDATHFVHHPRTAAIQAAGAEKIDSPRSLNTKFYFPFSDRTNIRYDVKLEPMGALGDLAWYSTRAVVERILGAVTGILTLSRKRETSSSRSIGRKAALLILTLTSSLNSTESKRSSSSACWRTPALNPPAVSGWNSATTSP
jgi:predicted dehydrogenase